ncbi:MAG: CBS domain-containing protein, partial [Candidatus Thorarchaeota archaeon]
MMVKDCMQSDVVHISVPGTREDVLQLMAEKQINGLPVVKKGSKTLVGIVTRSDLLRKADENQLALLMIRDPVTVSPRTDLKRAINLMLEKNYRRLPVVSKGELVGLLSIPDVLGIVLEEGKKYQTMDIK